MDRPRWGGTRRVLLHGGRVYSPVSPFATAMLIDGHEIAWLGEDSAAAAHRDSADVVIDLRNSLVTPGFVDGHVHATSTGLALTGLDLTACRSRGEVLDALTAFERGNPGGVLLGHGWDESQWPDPTLPSRAEMDRASRGRPAYLSRVDVHSALVSSALVDQCGDMTGDHGWTADLALSHDAHHRVRDAAFASVSAAQRGAAQAATRAHAAAHGTVAFHEIAGPMLSSEDDLQGLLRRAASEPGPVVTGYWGELASEGGIERALAIGALGVAGDLFADGSIGSRTAALRDPYTDVADSRGSAYLDPRQVAEHVIAATEAGLQAGFHVIGDRAGDVVVEGLNAAAAHLGDARVRAAQHRIEHGEMLTDAQIAVLARLGIAVSMQPLFDAMWGGPDGMYERRLGRRAASMNRFASIVDAGVLVAFGSDAPVTTMDPWATVRAAMHHFHARESLSARAAFAAHTRGGWRAARQPEAGAIAPGAPAHLAVWQADDVAVQVPDNRLSAWSTDPRSGTPGLPTLLPDMPLPQCRRTIVAGCVVHDDGFLESA